MRLGLAAEKCDTLHIGAINFSDSQSETNMNIPLDMVKNTIHKTKNNGDLKITNYVGKYEVYIEFIDTGFRRCTDSTAIRSGSVKDYMRPSVCGIGFLGIGEYKAQINRIKTKEYEVWGAMLKRCYSKITQEHSPSYVGVTVCDEWFDFQVFCQWFNDNYKEGMHLDKDILSKGSRQYNPLNCSFVSVAENNIEAHAKHYKFKWCNGYVAEVYNLTQFCKDNKLSQPCMSGVIHGNQQSHRGWSLP